MARTQTEIVGFMENTQKALRKVRKPLADAGHDPDAIDDILEHAVEECSEANAVQEEMKRNLKAQTVKVVALNRRWYGQTSSYLDAAIGAVGKGSDEAKNLQKLRSRIRMPAEEAVPTVEPLPEATQ